MKNRANNISSKSAKKHPFGAAIQIVLIAVLLVCMLLLNILGGQTGYNKLASINEFEAKEYFDGYIKTSELTDDDMSDEYQKNYQETDGSNGSYIIKSAEWTNQASGDAMITIKAASNEEAKGKVALYVATICYVHGLTENILVSNIETLIQYYDQVDFIAINNSYEAGIIETKTFTPNSTEAEIRSYIQEVRNSGVDYPHATMSVPAAIERYLFGGIGDSYVSEDNLQNDPTAIYVSCDTVLQNADLSDSGANIDGTWGVEYGTAKYFNFMEERYGDRYFTMSQYSKQDTTPLVRVQVSYSEEMMNVLLGVLHPEYYGEASSAMTALTDGETITGTGVTDVPFADRKYAADYNYTQTFEEANVTMVTETTIVDKISDKFTITSVEASNGTKSLTSTISGQTVTVLDTSYTTGDEITIKIYIKLNDGSSLDGFEDTNSTVATLTNGDDYLEVDSPKLALLKTSLVVTKVWDDNNNQDGIRPDSITLKLYANGEEVTDVTPTVNKSGNTWTYTYTDLDRYKDGGEITYTVEEVNSQDGYEVSYGNVTYNETNNRYEVTVTNTHKTGTTQISVTKVWNDDNDNDGKRPDNIKITLQKTVNGETEDVQTITLQATGDTWTYTFTDLPAYESGYEIEYTIKEESVSDYEANITGSAESGFTITNTHTPEQIDIPVTKVWDDNNNEKGNRPESVLVTLYADGETTGKTLTLNEENSWKGTFEGLEKYKDGNEIAYSVEETEVAENDLEYYEDPEITYDGNSVTITNSYIDIDPNVNTEITKTGTGEVTSLDDKITYQISYTASIDDYIGEGKITIVDYLPYEINEAESDLDGGAYNAENKTITWEEDIEHFNTYETGAKTITINKEITVLYVNMDTEAESIENTVEGTIELYETDTTITVEDKEEIPVDFKIDILVEKTWNDSDDETGHRPESIRVWLTGNGSKIEGYGAVLNEDNGWSYTFEDMPKYTNSGEEIEYGVVEEEIIEDDLEYYEDSVIEVTKVEDMENAPDGMEYDDMVVNITNNYRNINPNPETNLEKTGTEIVTSSDQTVNYEINYEAVIDSYIGGATVTIVDYLPYSLATDEDGNLVDGIDLDGGTYDESSNTITWVIEIDHINTFTNVGDLIADEDTEADEIDEAAETTNTNEIATYSSEEETVANTGAENTEVNEISETNTDEEEAQEEEEQSIGQYDTEGNYHINITKNITVIFEDLDPTQREMTNEVTALLFLDEGDIEIEDEDKYPSEIAIPGKVNAKYVDIDTEEEIADEENYEGLVGEEYQTEQKDIQYYEFVEVEGETEGQFEEQEKYVTYYYQKLPFNLAVDKNISKIVIDGTEQEVTNGKLSKVEVPVSSATSADLEVTYTIVVSNTGEIEGTADVVETIPDYFEVASGTSSEWQEQADGTLKAQVSLQPGETKELVVVLKWTAGTNNFGSLDNTVSLENVDNPAGFDETTTDDNMSEATLIVSVKTGMDKSVTAIALLIAVLLIVAGGVIISKKTLKK